MNRRLSRFSLPATVAGTGALALILFGAQPVLADTPAAPDCFAQCIATFDTAGAVGTFVVPVGAVNLTATLAGAAGAPAANSIDPGVGGSGGAATISLAASTPGSELKFGLGAVGQGSYLVAPSGTLIAVAGGGGGAGFAGYFGLPDQVLGSYAGGNGGSPISAGVHAGENGVEFPGATTQGLGGVGNAGGTGGTGSTAGAAGSSTTTNVGGIVTLAAGGVGASTQVNSIGYLAGTGGSGFSGGGGGAVADNIPNGDVPVGVVGPGGGGSAFLESGYSASAYTPNTGTGYVNFAWSYVPTITSNVSSVQRNESIPVAITGLPANRAFSVHFAGRAVLNGTADAAGTFSGAFAVASDQAAGSFPLQLLILDQVVASSDPIIVAVPSPRQQLAATGAENAFALVPLAALLLAAGALLPLATRRRSGTPRSSNS